MLLMAVSKKRATNEWRLVETLVEGLVDPLADNANAGGYGGVVKMGRWGEHWRSHDSCQILVLEHISQKNG